MIDTEKLEKPVSETLPAEDSPEAPEMDFRALPLAKLLSLYDEVKAALPAQSLADMNLEQETVLLYLSTKELMREILDEEKVAANQKAQVANTCAANLQQLVKMQLQLYTSERVKAIEIAITRTLKTLPTDVQMKFFEEYEKAYAMLSPAAGAVQTLATGE